MDEQAFSVTPANTLEPRVAEILKDYEKWRSARRPLEGPWYLNGAFLRGQQHVAYDDAMARLVSPVTPSYRIRLNINRIRPKIKARLAKFFKNRPKPVVMAASSERKDLLNARATQKVLEYQWFKQHLEEKYKDARLWATIASKGYWWFRWDEKQFGRMRVPQTDPQTGQPVMGANGQPQEIDQVAQLGDVSVEVGSPFEVLVADPSISRIGQQPKIIRARYINLADAKARYGDKLKDGKAETGQKLSNYKDLLSTLYPRGESMGSGIATPSHDDQVVEIEHFTAPTDQYPKGRYAVVVGAEQMLDKDELPYEMADMSENPFPCVEFSDTVAPGQYYGPTQIEQMIDLQREYNFLRELLSENIRMMARPKVLVYKQHNLQDGAWTNAAGEILELNWIPGLPPPQILQPANVAADVWNLLALVSREFDDLTQIYPSSEGKAGDASSGFQTNLLQESADSVHAPDIREDELSIEMAARKIRRLMKLGYQAPRLINILGPNSAPDVFEFCENQIDEYAEVRIQVGSMLPDLKSARGQMAMNMYEKGVLGNPQDPMVRKRTLELIDMGGMEVVQEDERRDEDQANQENMRLAQGQGVEHAQFFEDHMMHLMVHQNDFKAPETQQLTPQVKLAKIAHIITHYDWTNPQMGMALRRQYQLGNLPLATPPPLPPPPMGPSGPQPPQLGPGPAGPPGAPPPSPPSAASPHPPAPNVAGQTLHLHVKHEAPQPNSGPPAPQSPSLPQ